MLTNIRYVLITALRDRLFAAVLMGVLFCTVLSAVLGGTAFLEKQETTIVYAAGAVRIVLALGLIVFACFHVRSAFESKEIDVILSRPVSRASLVVSYWLGFCLVALILLLPVFMVMVGLGVLNKTGFAVWAMSLTLEVMLAAAMAMFAGFAMRSAVTAVLASLGFYTLSRMMAFFVMAADSPLFNEDQLHTLRDTLKAIAVLIPRLDLFAQTDWLIYGIRSAEAWQLVLLQAAIYLPLLLVMSVLDFRRKEF